MSPNCCLCVAISWLYRCKHKLTYFTGWALFSRPLCTAPWWPRSRLRFLAGWLSPCTPAPPSALAALLAPPLLPSAPSPARQGCSVGMDCPPSCTPPYLLPSSPPPRSLFSAGGYREREGWGGKQKRNYKSTKRCWEIIKKTKTQQLFRMKESFYRKEWGEKCECRCLKLEGLSSASLWCFSHRDNISPYLQLHLLPV